MRDNKLQELFQKGKITRREFIAGISAIGVTASISPLLLSKSAHAATPKKGGRFRIGYDIGTTNNTLDTTLMNSSAEYFISYACRNNLVEIDYKGNAIPELAEGWDVSEDLTTWVFDIRKGVEFHNGKKMDAEDVLYSLNLHRGETKSTAKTFLATVKDIKADGKYRVIFTLEQGNLDFQYILSDYRMVIVPAGTAGEAWKKCIGTGAFVMQKFEPGVRAFAKRNPNYWKEGRGHFDELEITVITDASSRTNALKTGRVDFIPSADTKTAHLLERDKNIQLISMTMPFHYAMPMRSDTAPYDNNDVRLAMKYAIDREQIVDIGVNGFGSPGNDHPIAPSYKYFASELPQREYDPDKAKYHLKKSGLENHTFTLSTMDSRGLLDFATLYKEQAAKAGIKIQIDSKPSDGYWSNVWMKAPFACSYWQGRPTIDTMFTVVYAAEAKWNESFWKHGKFNKLLVDARRERNESKRGDMYGEMQRILMDEGSTIIYMFGKSVMAANKKVKFENVAANLDADGLRAPERWWFES
ncbi:MAG: peptide ABC transporter substrate-binding protein [Deltaproteobacteria bacterium]|nr:MAG: peptide ABC transporter substrate-binding protein [Deltaproteobacteria bacterium]